jgi:hypothetical protein
MPSIVAEIGAVIEDHLKHIGMIIDEELSPEQRRLITEKRAAYESRSTKKNSDVGASSSPSPATAGEGRDGGALPSASAAIQEATGYPPGATMCLKCNTKATIIMDGCATCLSCGYSKCG